MEKNIANLGLHEKESIKGYNPTSEGKGQRPAPKKEQISSDRGKFTVK